MKKSREGSREISEYDTSSNIVRNLRDLYNIREGSREISTISYIETRKIFLRLVLIMSL